MSTRTIKTTTGAEIPLDGDLLAIMETLYREVTARRELEVPGKMKRHGSTRADRERSVLRACGRPLGYRAPTVPL